MGEERDIQYHSPRGFDDAPGKQAIEKVPAEKSLLDRTTGESPALKKSKAKVHLFV